MTSACANPGCPCRDAKVTAFRVGEWLAGVAQGRGKVSFYHGAAASGREPGPAQVAPVLKATLDIDTGAVAIAEHASPDERDEEALAWLRDELDGTLLDHLAEKVLRCKGIRPLSRIEVRDYEPGLMVYWVDAYLAGRVDCYVIDGRRFAVLDTYCVDPFCSCREIRLQVYRDQEEIGSFVVDLAASDWSQRSHDGSELDRVWRAFTCRYPDPGLFRQRADLMKKAGPDIMASARPAPPVAPPRVGRNEPCPCGSGKKYKRCCLPKNTI